MTNTMFEDFYFWITSLVEDDPIPYEIKHLYFVLNFKNSICSLSFAGSELFFDVLTNFEFYPLEAYFFKNESFNNIKDIFIAKTAVKELFEKSMLKSDFKSIFKNKKVYLCERGESVEFEFNI